MAINFTNINKTNNKQSLKITNKCETTTYGLRNPGLSLGQAQQYYPEIYALLIL